MKQIATDPNKVPSLLDVEDLQAMLDSMTGGWQSHILLVSLSEFGEEYKGRIGVFKQLGFGKGLSGEEVADIRSCYELYTRELDRIGFPYNSALKTQAVAVRNFSEDLTGNPIEWHVHMLEEFKGPGRDIKHELLHFRATEKEGYQDIFLKRYRDLLALLYSVPVREDGRLEVAIDFKPDNFVCEPETGSILMIDTYPPKIYEKDGLLHHFPKLDPNFSREYITDLCTDLVWMSARMRKEFSKIDSEMLGQMDEVMRKIVVDSVPAGKSKQILAALDSEFKDLDI
ncbi:MAG: hypothetical protein ACOCXP_00125 [Candidatus Dojkabacteria bacterium]